MPDGSITPVNIDDEKLVEKFAQLYPNRITMKDCIGYKLLTDRLGISDTEDAKTTTQSRGPMTKKEAFALLADAMLETKVYRYIDVESITKVFEKEYKSKRRPLAPPIGMRLLIGLADVDKPEDETLLMDAGQTYWNSLIAQNRLRTRNERPADKGVSLTNPKRWLEDANLADKAIYDDDPGAARDVYETMFTHLLEDRTTTASLYRLVANMANTYFVLGAYATALDLLERAEALCPTYDFPKQMRTIAESGYYKPITDEDVYQVYWTPAHDYLEWFDTLGIDLSAGDGHQTSLNKRLDKKVGRNDPCICGALRSNGLPVKYKNCHGA